MKIVDTFLFSEPHESDLLFIKFNLEDRIVDEWFIQENEYTLQGDHKGLFANEVLKEERFKPFLNKVTVISESKLHEEGNKTENINFLREGWQRNICRGQLLKKYLGEDTLVMVSDVDEMIDFSSEERTRKFEEIVQQHYPNPFSIGRMRYWYDYDNRCFLPNIRIPVVSLLHLNSDSNILSNIRHHQHINAHDAGEEPLAFEYSYVFNNLEDVWRKKCTYAHTNFTMESVKTGLECNHWPRTMNRNEKVGDNEYDFFETVELHEQNSPKFIRENLETFKTNIVDKNYVKNRQEKYGFSRL